MHTWQNLDAVRFQHVLQARGISTLTRPRTLGEFPPHGQDRIVDQCLVSGMADAFGDASAWNRRGVGCLLNKVVIELIDSTRITFGKN
ncbi:Uncharacterised protein [Mycobacteroides abscessus subsp. massiliense]|nr:Uncharacterised protein [Mycobacteroides abscessus subsp. massiliense]